MLRITCFFWCVCVCVYCFCFDSVRSYKIGLSDVQTKKRSVLNPRVPLIIMFSREILCRCRVWSSHLTPYRRNGSKRPRFDCFPARRGTIAHLALRPPPTPTDTLQKKNIQCGVRARQKLSFGCADSPTSLQALEYREVLFFFL